jgi:hypothetical protein
LFGKGLFLFLFGLLWHDLEPTWRFLTGIVCDPLMMLGVGLMLIPLIARYTDIPRLADTSIDSGFLYTQSGQKKVRYYINAQDERLYVARDVCRVAGTTPPKKDATRLLYSPLVLSNQALCLTEKELLVYLNAIADGRPAAKQLLIDLSKEGLTVFPKRHAA